MGLQLDDVGAVAEGLHVDEGLHPLEALPGHLPDARHAHLMKGDSSVEYCHSIEFRFKYYISSFA